MKKNEYFVIVVEAITLIFSSFIRAPGRAVPGFASLRFFRSKRPKRTKPCTSLAQPSAHTRCSRTVALSLNFAA